MLSKLGKGLIGEPINEGLLSPMAQILCERGGSLFYCFLQLDF